ncbi:MAG: hypothetical protein F4W91_04960, partial [Gemmatimonadetes bacterium]|nr:hypothetical protein [Gemmatimonadota bacterium]
MSKLRLYMCCVHNVAFAIILLVLLHQLLSLRVVANVIEMDVVGVSMYWVDRGTSKIQRSNLDGSNVEDLITTGLDLPSGIALDISGGKMYWVDRGADKIQRSNLNGSNVEDLITTGLTTPVSIALQIPFSHSEPTAPSITVPSPDFDGSGFVDLQDFLLFSKVFGFREGQEGYDAKYDLNGDGKIASEDYVIYLQSYGKWMNHAPAFRSQTYTTHFIDENTPEGEPIGDPITATDADGDMLTYGLSGTDVELFAIDARTGQIRTKESITYDYEHRTTYSVIVEVSDGQGGTAHLLVIIKINDLKEPPSSPPSGFRVIPDNESLTVHYHAVPDEQGRPPVRGYHAEIRRGEKGSWGTRKTIYGRRNTSVYYHRIDPEGYHSRILVNGQLYQVRVRAYNSDGASEWSAPVSGTPVFVSSKEKSGLTQFQGEGEGASAEIDLSRFTGKGGRIVVTRAALPATVSQEDVVGVFVEVIQVKTADVPDIPTHKGFTISGSPSFFDIELKSRANNRNVNIGSALREPVDICLPVPETISEPVLIYYDSSRKIWEMLGEQRVDGKVVCAFTDRLSLFGVGLKVDPINSPPLTNGTIAAQTMMVGTSGTVDVSGYFRDPDNDQLTYTAMSSDENIATVSTMGSVITITPMSSGSVTITVTGSDGRLGVNQTFIVTVSAPPPPPANNAPVSTGKMYWMDRGTDKIQRSNLDGSSVEDLITTGLSAPVGIALDISGGKMYWIDEGTDKIQRANIDGTGVEDLVTTGLNAPSGIALDPSGGKMYWVDRGTDKIQRSNLDGSSVEDLITTGLSAPVGIALDISGGKMYWVDNSADKIQRANLDGSSVEDLVMRPTLSAPVGVALDISGGKMYWIDEGTDK